MRSQACFFNVDGSTSAVHVCLLSADRASIPLSRGNRTGPKRDIYPSWQLSTLHMPTRPEPHYGRRCLIGSAIGRNDLRKSVGALTGAHALARVWPGLVHVPKQRRSEGPLCLSPLIELVSVYERLTPNRSRLRPRMPL